MASYEKTAHRDRIIQVAVVPNVFATVYVSVAPPSAVEEPIHGAEDGSVLYREDEVGSEQAGKNAYNYPFVLHKNGTPWIEVNSFFYSRVQNHHSSSRPTDNARRDSAELMEYLTYCEQTGIDWKDFSGSRPSQRPTYKYFNHLKNAGQRSGRVANHYTGIVYEFYVHVSRYWHAINLELVDTVKSMKQYVSTARGSFLVDRVKRSQTFTTPPATSPEMGFVRDEGEDLRPLTNPELLIFREVMKSRSWSVQDRLIVDTALMTGARKQTVLTIRRRHLKFFNSKNLRRDNTYALSVGPGTGIDTKSGKSFLIFVPQKLAERLITWDASPVASNRRRKFIEQTSGLQSGKPLLSDDDMYVFLSDQGNAYYMAKNDPRYAYVKTVPTGQVTSTIRKKILKLSNQSLPKDFTFHWLRATFAYQLFQYLQLAVKKKLLRPGDEISIIQIRLAHSYREITEHYLRLFMMINENLAAQEGWEDWLIGGEHLLVPETDMGDI
ncbi:site-specific integrase [Pseudomonas sp. S2_H01]